MIHANNTHRHGHRQVHGHRRAGHAPAAGGGAIHNTQYDGLINRAAQRYGVDPALIKAMVCKESQFDTHARSGAGARGLMQMMPATARSLGVTDPTNPEQNIMAGTRYMGQLLKQYHGDERLALAAYNAGPGNVRKYGGVPPFAETRTYVARVSQFRNEYASAGVSAQPGQAYASNQPQSVQAPASLDASFAQMLAGLSGPSNGTQCLVSPQMSWMFNQNQAQPALLTALTQQSLLFGLG